MLLTDLAERMLVSSPVGKGEHISAGEHTLTQHRRSPSTNSHLLTLVLPLLLSLSSSFHGYSSRSHYDMRIVTGENNTSSCSDCVMAGALRLCRYRTFIFADGVTSLQPIHSAISIYFIMISKQNSCILPVQVNILIKIMQRR